MKQIKQSGFTIIEVVLFLAISGLLAVGLMVGTGVAIQRQQYRDSVQSYANFLRNQYGQVISVENREGVDRECPLRAGTDPRGRSSCVIVGRYIAATDASGQKYSTYPIYATEDGADNWVFGYDNDKADGEYEPSWGVNTLLVDGSATRAPFSVVMSRHPETGVLAIHANPATVSSADVGGLIDVNEDDQEICVFSNGWLIGERQSVFIGAMAGSGDAITVGNASSDCKSDA